MAADVEEEFWGEFGEDDRRVVGSAGRSIVTDPTLQSPVADSAAKQYVLTAVGDKTTTRGGLAIGSTGTFPGGYLTERKRKGGAERERIKRKKALDTDTASCCKIPAMFAIKGTGEEGSSSSTSAANAPAVELEVVDSSAFESEQEPSERLDVQSEREKDSGKDEGDSESLAISFAYFARSQSKDLDFFFKVSPNSNT